MEELFWGLLGLGVVLLPIFLLIRSVGKISRLERDVLELRGRVTGLERGQTLAVGQPESPVSSAFATHQLSTLIDLETLKEGMKDEHNAQEGKGIKAEEQTVQEPDAAANPVTNDQATNDQAPSPPPPTKTSREWEAFVGGRLFNRIGAAAIILGIGFFLKYAFDNDLIPEWLRVVMGLATGAALIAGALQARKRDFEVFAQGLVGAGLGTLYLSVYATYNFYHLVSIPVAFGGMITVTALGFVLALRFESLAIALIAWFGGFITPLLFHTETPNVLGLFAYLLFLNCGLLALVFMRDAWFVLKPLSFIATYGIALLWYADKYTTLEHFGIATTFAVLYWALFFIVDSYRALQGLSRNDALWRKADSFLNSSVSYAALFALVYDGARVWMPLATILYAAAYFLVSQLVRRRDIANTFSFRRYTFTAIVYLFLATAQQFSREWLIIAWSLEFAFIFFLAWRVKEKFVVLVMLCIGLLIWAAFFYMKDVYFIEVTTELKPLVLTAYIAVIASFLAVAVMLERLLKDAETSLYNLPTADGKQVSLGNPIHYAWGIQAGYLLHYLLDVALRTPTATSLEAGILGLFGGYTRFGVYGIAHILFFLFFAWLGRRTKWREITHISLMVFVIFAVMFARGFAYEPATAWQLLFNIRVLMLLTGTAAAIVFMRLWDEDNPTVPKFLRPHTALILGGTSLLLVFALLTGEASDFWHSDIMRLYELPQGATTLARIAELENGKQLSISLVWLVYAIALMVAGIVRHARTVRVAALGLAGLAVAKIFLYDLSFLTTPYRIGSFIGLGVVLMMVSFLYQRFKHIILEE